MEVIANVGMTNIDMFNMSSSTGYKEAVRQGISGECTGACIVNKTNNDGETIQVSAVKVDDKIYSGNSSVMLNRIEELINFVGEDLENGINVAFDTLKCKDGDAVTLLIKG